MFFSPTYRAFGLQPTFNYLPYWRFLMSSSSSSVQPRSDFRSTTAFPSLGSSSSQANPLQVSLEFFNETQSRRGRSERDINQSLRIKIRQLSEYSSKLTTEMCKAVKIANALLSNGGEVDRKKMKKAISSLEKVLTGQALREKEKPEKAEKTPPHLLPDTSALNINLANLLNDLCCQMQEASESEKIDPKQLNEHLSEKREIFSNLTDELKRLFLATSRKIKMLEKKIEAFEKRQVPEDHIASIAKYQKCTEEEIKAKIEAEKKIYESQKKQHDELQLNLLGIKILTQGIEWELKRLDLTANLLFNISDLSAKLSSIFGKLDIIKSLIRDHPETPEANLLKKCENIKKKYLELGAERLSFQEDVFSEIADLTKKIAEDEKDLRSYIAAQKLYDENKTLEINQNLTEALSNIIQERTMVLNDLQVIWRKVVEMIDKELFVEINRTHDGVKNKSISWRTTYEYFSMRNAEDLYLKLPTKEEKAKTE